MRNIILAVSLCWASGPALAAEPLDADTLAMVTAFVKMKTGDLPPDSIDRFLAVDMAALPEKLRKPFEAKRFELNVLRHMAQKKKSGTVRMPEADCSTPQEAKANQSGIMQMAGFEEIFDNELLYLMKTTLCTERDMMCEFSLQIILEKDPKSKKPHPRYFLHQKDPLFALVGEYRGTGSSHNTKFFGRGGPSCAPRLK
ncbi:MAG: hypothetical protein AAB320_06910 [Elusimicrobiota bacterium]